MAGDAGVPGTKQVSDNVEGELPVTVAQQALLRLGEMQPDRSAWEDRGEDGVEPGTV
jgi:hypothetical protein